MCGLFSLSTMQPAVLSEQIGKSEQRNRESGKGVKGAHNCKGEMKTTMSSILQIYLLRTCMYVCMYECMYVCRAQYCGNVLTLHTAA